MIDLKLDRRAALRAFGAAAASLAAPAVLAQGATRARVVVIGGGFGGATAAKYLRKWSAGAIDVTLIERNQTFISCPGSNETLSGERAFDTLVHGYDKLAANWGVNVVQASVTGVDAAARAVTTDKAGVFAYDRLVLAPGFDFIPGGIKGYDPESDGKVLHAWKAGPQTLALRKQLEALPDGGVYMLSIPLAPYRCPPGPYERASQIAHYFKRHKPKSKVVILDANDKVISKEKLFTGVWEADYKGILEYRPKWRAVSFDPSTGAVTSELGDVEKPDILNLVPPQRAAGIARLAGVVNVNDRWADIEWRSFESTAVKGVHVAGDALQAAPLMPKSGHMANQHGKAIAAALVEIFAGREPQPTLLANTCYSMVDGTRGIHVDSVHRYDAEKKTHLVVEGSGGVSKEPSVDEGQFTRAWAESIWADTLG
jgi:NADPH-dependent 2,4-dienoyl-CoA reductase/sulfur reductase-like enzyme